MTAKIDVLAAAPSLIKEWRRSFAISASLDPGLSELVKSGPPRSTAAPTASTCMRCMRAKTEKPSSASTCCPPGARPRAILIASVPRSAGPRR